MTERFACLILIVVSFCMAGCEVTEQAKALRAGTLVKVQPQISTVAEYKEEVQSRINDAWMAKMSELGSQWRGRAAYGVTRSLRMNVPAKLNVEFTLLRNGSIEAITMSPENDRAPEVKAATREALTTVILPPFPPAVAREYGEAMPFQYRFEMGRELVSPGAMGVD